MKNIATSPAAESTPATEPKCSCLGDDYIAWCYAGMGSSGGCGGCLTCQSARHSQETCPVHGSGRRLR